MYVNTENTLLIKNKTMNSNLGLNRILEDRQLWVRDYVGEEYEEEKTEMVMMCGFPVSIGSVLLLTWI